MPDKHTNLRIVKIDSDAIEPKTASECGEGKKLQQRLRGIAIDASFGLGGDFPRTDFWAPDFADAWIDWCRKKIK
jgi:hypothetical protein